MKKTGSIMEMKGCIPKLDRVVTIEEMDEAIAEAVMEDWDRFERELRAERLQQGEIRVREDGSVLDKHRRYAS
jgi:hypothetical protein